MPSASRIAHAGLAFAHPMSEAAVHAAIAALPLSVNPLILDMGCGNGEVLLRTLKLHAPARGLGVDLDPDAIADAQRRANGMSARFEVRDAATIHGRFDAVINVGSSHACGGFPAALRVIRELAPVALYGEGFWQRPPSQDFLAALGDATADELAEFDGLRAAIRDVGFDIRHESLASEHDWTFYEETLAANAARHGTPDTLSYAERIRHRRALRHGTHTLGFGLFVLQG